jgi:chorismate mutase
MDKNLDLDGSIRPGLDILANEIVIALKKRTRFKQNLEIYEPGLVIGKPQISLLDYELNRQECCHAELGRYMYASQEALTDVSGTRLIIKRDTPENQVIPFSARQRPRIMSRYLQWIKAGCDEGSDSDTWGESVTADVAALLNICERINLGKYVAEFKYLENPEPFQNTNGRENALRELIVKKEREEAVLEMARKLAAHYEFDSGQAENWFRWMIECTVELEIDYLRERLKFDGF